MTAAPKTARLRSWPDAVIAAVDRVPGPPWVFYGILTLACITAFIGQRLADGVQINPVTLGYTAFTVLPIAVMHYANRAAGHALRDFRPALGDLEPDYSDLERGLTTMSFRSALVAALLGAGVLTIGQLTAGGLWGINSHNSLATNVVTAIMQFVLNAGFAAFVFHSVAQVRLITVIHRDATAIELWNTPPHNAFSRLTLIMAIFLVVPYTAVEVVSASLGQLTTVEVVIFAVAIVLAIALFVLPLSGMRARLMREKTRQVDDSSRALAVVAARLHAAADSGDYSIADKLQNAMTGLALERDRLTKVSTWPWTADTFRGFVTTLGIPLVLWFLTTLLGRVIF